MNDHIKSEIAAHAEELSPRECCGLIVVIDGEETYVRCENMALKKTEHFQISREDYATAETLGEVAAIVHSHPYAQPTPSDADLAACETSKLKWIIYAWPLDTWHEFEPSGYVAPLTGRKFVWGVHDCYTLVQDYYKTVLGLDLPDRPADWQDHKDSVYFDEFKSFGFEEVDSPQLHDLILMKIKGVGHAAVYLGDGDVMLHHPQDNLSAHGVYGGYYRKHTLSFIRHKSLMGGIV